MSKWFLEVVQDFDGSYYANLTIDAVLVKGLPEYVDYKTLKKAIEDKTGIVILNKNEMKFQQNGRKKYAYIDATQTRPDCRVTLDEIYNGWEPNFDYAWITVYKDVLGYQDDKDNLTEILVPKQWLIDALKVVESVEDFKQWSEEYTADNTISLAQKAMREGVIKACADENISFEQKSVFAKDKTIYKRAANLVEEALNNRDGEDLFYIGNIYFMLSLSECETELTRDELLKLTERVTEAAYNSAVPLLTAERVDAVRTMLEDGITANRSAVLPVLTPVDAKKVLLNCTLEDFCTIVDQLAVDNQRFYGPDKDDITAEDINKVEKAIAGILNEAMDLDKTIAIAEAQKSQNIETGKDGRDNDRDL